MTLYEQIIQEGIEKGRVEGLQKGLQKGKHQATIRMIQKRASNEYIVDVLDVTEDFVQAIRLELKS